MKKSKKQSVSMYILGVAWTLCSLVWLLAENIPMAIVWFVVGVFELIAATVTRRKEKLEEEQSEDKQDDETKAK
jgi:uncharacterized membrane protein